MRLNTGCPFYLKSNNMKQNWKNNVKIQRYTKIQQQKIQQKKYNNIIFMKCICQHCIYL